MKQVSKVSATFNPAARTVDLSAISGFTPSSLVSIINISKKKIIYCPAMEDGFCGTFSGSVVTLQYDTTSHSAGDLLQIQTDDQVYITNGALHVRPVTDATGIKRGNFTSATGWDMSGVAASDLATLMGGAAGCSWLSVAKSALVAGTETVLISSDSWTPAIAAAVAMSLSQRLWGQEFAIELVGQADGTSVPLLEADPTPVALSNAGAVASGTTLIYTTQTDHGLKAGMLVSHYGCTDARVNYGPVAVTGTPSPTTYTITTALGAATYVTGNSGFVLRSCPDGRAMQVLGHRFIGTTSGNNDTVARNGTATALVSNWNVGNTNDAPVSPVENGITYSNLSYAQALRARSEYSIRFDHRRAVFTVRDLESNISPRSSKISHQSAPDPTLLYRLRVRVKSFLNSSVPLYPVTNANKASASTTAVLTIGAGHMLTTANRVCYVGARDQTNFPNQTTSLAISAVDSVAGTITVAFGTSVISSSYGGFVYAPTGGDVAGAMTIASSSIQSYQRVTDSLGSRLKLTFLASPGAGIQVGEIVTVYGLVDSGGVHQSGLNGRYRVDLWNTTTFTVELTPLDGQGTSLGSVSATLANAGGTLIKNTELRLHGWRIEHNEPVRTEVVGGPGDSGQADAIPVQVPAGITVNSVAGIVSVVGTAAHSAAASGNSVRTGGKTITAVDTTLANGDHCDMAMTTSGQAVFKLNATPELEFTIVSPSGGTIVNSASAVTVQSAPAASTRNYYNGIVLAADTLSAAVELTLRDATLPLTTAALSGNTLVASSAHGMSVGDAVVFQSVTGITGLTAGVTYYVLTTPATTSFTLAATLGGSTLTVTGTPAAAQTFNHVLWRTKLQTSGIAVPTMVPLPAPLRGGVGVAQELVTSAAVTGGIYFTGQGYRGV
ncbi:MAG: hypothetical protein WCO60_19780 [Verrucomicrobiota bacterium]